MGNPSVSDVMPLMKETDRDILRKMLDRECITNDTPILDVVSKFQSNGKLVREEQMALLAAAFVNKNRFVAKLTLRQRCEVLALRRSGISRESLAKMYGIDRRTVTHIYNDNSPHYKDVRAIEKGMGKDAFIKEYLNDELVNKALAYRQKQETEEPNNRMARGKEGVHSIRGKDCEYDHRIIISWRDADEKEIEVSGWYYKDLDGDYPDNWLSSGPASLKTSNACFVGMLSQISDKLT